MPAFHSNSPALEPRFLAPSGWEWARIERTGYTLRYGHAAPNKEMRGVVVCLPGLSEFCEKYFEIAHDFLSQGFGVVVIDWRGQGLSSRYLANPHKRHSHGFDCDVADLLAVLSDCPIVNGAPLFMLAHSMGGQIGLRTILENPALFKAVAFSAPLFGLHIFQSVPDRISSLTTENLARFFPESYAPMGGDWTPMMRDMNNDSLFSRDSARAAVHNAWMLACPDLQVGHITHRWLADAFESCRATRAHPSLPVLDIPCLIGMAGHENFVDNQAICDISSRLTRSDLLDLPESRHEILMEKDSVRSIFLDRLYSIFTNFV